VAFYGAGQHLQQAVRVSYTPEYHTPLGKQAANALSSVLLISGEASAEDHP